MRRRSANNIVAGRDALEIVGVCADVKQFGLDAGRTADLYVPIRQIPVQTTRAPLTIADGVRSAVRGIDKDVATSSTRTINQMRRRLGFLRRLSEDALV